MIRYVNREEWLFFRHAEHRFVATRSARNASARLAAARRVVREAVQADGSRRVAPGKPRGGAKRADWAALDRFCDARPVDCDLPV